MGADTAKTVTISFPLHYPDPCQCGRDGEFWSETLTEKWLQNVQGKKISLWTLLILFIAFGFKRKEEMIPGGLDWSLKRLEYSAGSLKTRGRGGSQSAPFCSHAGFHLLLYLESPGARQVKLSEYHSPHNLFPIPSIPWDAKAVS